MNTRLDELMKAMFLSNTALAELSGYDRSYISYIRRGERKPAEDTEVWQRLGAALRKELEKEEYKEVLASIRTELGETDDAFLASWLFREEEISFPLKKRRRGRAKKERSRREDLHSFGEKLGVLMKTLELSNVMLAKALNVDSSLISRFRTGVRSPEGNREMMTALFAFLDEKMKEEKKTLPVASLTGIREKLLRSDEGAALLREWMLRRKEGGEGFAMDQLMAVIDAFVLPDPKALRQEEGEKAEEQEVYWGKEGLRTAVLRFLGEARGELRLYSDEPMEWIGENPSFRAAWSRAMVSSMIRGCKIHIVHNMDRSTEEMISAIQAWLPLYMTGRIYPYVSRRARNERFWRTLFLEDGRAAIQGIRSIGSERSSRWYDYIQEEEKLRSLREDFDLLLQGASPLLRVYTGEETSIYRSFESEKGSIARLLLGPSLASMPESLIQRISAEEPELLPLYRRRKSSFEESLQKEERYDLLCLPSSEEIRRGEVRMNLDSELVTREFCYTAEEYRDHLLNVLHILEEHPKYRLCLIPHLPFPSIQLLLDAEGATILRCKKPYAAFVFTDSLLSHAMEQYMEGLRKRYETTPEETIRRIREKIREIEGE